MYNQTGSVNTHIIITIANLHLLLFCTSKSFLHFREAYYRTAFYITAKGSYWQSMKQYPSTDAFKYLAKPFQCIIPHKRAEGWRMQPSLFAVQNRGNETVATLLGDHNIQLAIWQPFFFPALISPAIKCDTPYTQQATWKLYFSVPNGKARQGKNEQQDKGRQCAPTASNLFRLLKLKYVSMHCLGFLTVLVTKHVQPILDTIIILKCFIVL